MRIAIDISYEGDISNNNRYDRVVQDAVDELADMFGYVDGEAWEVVRIVALPTKQLWSLAEEMESIDRELDEEGR